MLAGSADAAVLAPDFELDAGQRLAHRGDAAADRGIVGTDGGAMVLGAEPRDRRAGFGEASGVDEIDVRQPPERAGERRLRHLPAELGRGARGARVVQSPYNQGARGPLK